jgi:AraC family ethanolamine operon transcriptional activator
MKYKNFTDFDDFVSNVRDVDSSMMLHNVTRHSWKIAQVILPTIELQVGHLGSGNIIEGQSWQNGYLIYLPINQRCSYLVNGEFLDKFSFMVLEPGSEFCLSSQAQHDWCSIFVPSNKLIHGGAREKTRTRITTPSAQLAKQFLNLMQSIMNTASNYSKFESSPAAKYATEKMLEVATLIIEQPQTAKLEQKGRPKFSRQEIIIRSQDFLKKSYGRPVLISEWAVTVQVSERTLRNVFKDYFQISPHRYLQIRQAHQVYRALRAAEAEEVLVSDVLLLHGVFDFGRFASLYQQMFGELPSKTLAKKAIC